MVPKVIHYVWLGGQPKNKTVKTAIESWQKYAPDYQIMEWNEQNFDISESAFLAAAVQKGEYAFASDYIRLAVLAKYGGMYLDTDMIMIQPVSNIELKEVDLTIARITDRQIFGMGFIMSVPNQPFIQTVLEKYKQMTAGDLNKRIANTELLSQWFAEYYPDVNIYELQEQFVSGVRILPMRYIYQPGKHSIMLHVGVASWKKSTLKNKLSTLVRSHITSRKRILAVLPVYNLVRRR